MTEVIEEKCEYLYRYKDSPNYSWDYENEIAHKYGMSVSLEKYRILSYTKCGVWIAYGCSKKFVNLERVKKFACKTLEDALDSFIARKRSQVRIYSARLKDAEEALHIAKNMKEKGKFNEQNCISFEFSN